MEEPTQGQVRIIGGCLLWGDVGGVTVDYLIQKRLSVLIRMAEF